MPKIFKLICTHRLHLFFLAVALFFLACKTAPKRTPVSSGGGTGERIEGRQPSGSVSEEIRRLIETGRLSSMIHAMDLIQDRGLGGIEFGRVMNGIITIFVRQLYPDSGIQLLPLDLPQTNYYARIIREAEKGNYVPPPENSTDFFEYVLPFFSVNDNTASDILSKIIKDLEKAGGMQPLSVLPPYFQGLIYERTGQFENAVALYAAAYKISDECYSALMGIARAEKLSGRDAEAVTQLSELTLLFPGNLRIKRQLAVTLYENGDWGRAEPAVNEILEKEPRNEEFLLMKASILTKRGQYAQALAPLEICSSINPAGRLYLFLRAKIQYEGYHNRDSALNYLRSIIRNNPDDAEALIYAADLLMESQKESDQTECREFLQRLQKMSGSSATVLSLSLRDAVRRESWQEAQGFLSRILLVRRDAEILQDAYLVERGLGNNAKALAYAKELYDRGVSNDEYIAVYISALIDNDRRGDASRMLEKFLSAPAGAAAKSRYFFLRSRLQEDEEAAYNDLLSSLFENPRNLEALIAMFEIYHRRHEERRAVYYLKQALALAPGNSRIKRYEAEYASLLGKE